MPKQGILLINLGSPDSPSVPDVRRYLNEFLMDKHVISVPWLIRRLIVSLFVLPTRPPKSAEAYQSIWWPEGSPLVVISQQVRDALAARLQQPVVLAMRYGNPSVNQALDALVDTGVEQVKVIPLYPHYAASTVLTAVEAIEQAVAKRQLNLQLQTQPVYYDDADYVNALVASAGNWLNESYDHLLFSYHGLPEAHLRKADPTGNHCLSNPNCCQQPSPAHATCYRHQVLATTDAFVRAANIPEGKYSVAFQSRLGRAKWLEPYAEPHIEALAKQGVKRLLVMCPAFVSDCLETLEEIGIGAQETFVAAGGESLTLIPCLNDHPAWIDVLEKWSSPPE